MIHKQITTIVSDDTNTSLLSPEAGNELVSPIVFIFAFRSAIEEKNIYNVSEDGRFV